MSTDLLDTGMTQSPSENGEDKITQRNQAVSQTDIELICTKLEDPKFDPAELLRLVTCEIAGAVMQMRSLGFTAEEGHIRSWLFQRVEVLRILGKQLMDTHLFRKKEDFLNFDGEVYEHLLRGIMDWFAEAAKQAGLEEFERNMIWRNFRDLAAENEPQLRRELKALQR